MDAKNGFVVTVGREVYSVVFPGSADLTQVLEVGKVLAKPRTYRQFMERLQAAEELVGGVCRVSLLKAA